MLAHITEMESQLFGRSQQSQIGTTARNGMNRQMGRDADGVNTIAK